MNKAEKIARVEHLSFVVAGLAKGDKSEAIEEIVRLYINAVDTVEALEASETYNGEQTALFRLLQAKTEHIASLSETLEGHRISEIWCAKRFAELGLPFDRVAMRLGLGDQWTQDNTTTHQTPPHDTQPTERL